MTDNQINERFISLLERNIGIILKISKAYTSTAQDCEDLFHDIAFEMWKAFPDFKGISKISTWIYRIALNTAMNYKRNTKRNKVFLQSAIEFNVPEAANETDENPLMEILYECIAELDEFNKAIIILYLDGYKHEEIAKITGISKTNVGTRILRIKEELKNKAVTIQQHYGT